MATGYTEEITNILPQAPYAGSTVEFSIQNTVSSLTQHEKEHKTSQLLPNPVKKGNTVSLIYNSTNEKPVDLKLLDLTGKILLEQTHETIAGSNIIPIDTNNLTSGIYLVCAANGNPGREYNHLIVN